jgi:hypothetical protein
MDKDIGSGLRSKRNDDRDSSPLNSKISVAYYVEDPLRRKAPQRRLGPSFRMRSIRRKI